MSGPRVENAREDAERVARAVIACVTPERLVARAWDGLGELIGEGACDVVALGKASVGMAAAVMERLDTRVQKGIVLAAVGREDDAERLRERCRGLLVRVVDHPTPTARNVRAAAEVERFVLAEAESGEGRTLLVLISGGGSAHLTLPAEDLEMEAIADVSGRLMRAGADITELNMVRKHLERLKGGRLAALASGGGPGGAGAGYARVAGVVVSDVIGDDLSVIASGPLTADATKYADALRVLERRGVGRHDAPAVWRHLERGARGEIAETPKAGDRAFDRVVQRVIGSNADAIRAASDALRGMGFGTVEERVGVGSEAADVGREMVDRAVEIAARVKGTAAIVWGGETTVRVGEGRGVGGRNQEFVLAAAERLARVDAGERIAVMSFATDGVDGPTDAAGAVATNQTWGEMRRAGLDPARALDEHDSGGVLEAGSALIRTGPTGTNVNDVMVAMVYAAGDVRQEGER